MQRERCKLITNVPMTFTLENPVGREAKSKFTDGLEYLYFVTHEGRDCVLYLPVDGRLAMDKAGARAGDQVQITKTMRNNRAVFEARRFSDAHLAVDVTPPAPRSVPTPAPQQGVRMLAPQSQIKAEPQPPPFTPMPQTPPTEAVHPLEQTMQRCFVIGGRALFNAHAELLAQGCTYDAPTMEDLRAAGISLFIERTRK